VRLLDTGGLLAAIASAQRLHAEAAAALKAAEAPRILSPFVPAELDYLLETRVSQAAQTELLREVARGAYQLAPFSETDVDSATQVIGRYSDLAPGLADASIVVLAHRYGTAEVLTLDQRTFRTLRTHDGKAFRLLPFDSTSDAIRRQSGVG
jgi:hypothetical protein